MDEAMSNMKKDNHSFNERQSVMNAPMERIHSEKSITSNSGDPFIDNDKEQCGIIDEKGNCHFQQSDAVNETKVDETEPRKTEQLSQNSTRNFEFPLFRKQAVINKNSGKTNDELLSCPENKERTWKSIQAKVGLAATLITKKKIKRDSLKFNILLLPHEREYLRDLFNNFDILKRGLITHNDFEVILRTFLNRNILPQEVANLLGENDIHYLEDSHVVVISLNTFLSIMAAAVETYRKSRTKETLSDWEQIGEIVVNKANRRRMLLRSPSTGMRWRSEDEESTTLYRNFMEPFKIRSNRSENMKKGKDSIKVQSIDEVDSNIKAQIRCIGPWNPECWQKNVWDFLIMLLVVFQSIYIPFVFCFQPELSNHWQHADLFSDVFFSVDLVITFNFMYRLSEGTPLISDRRLIAQNYFCGWFTVDFLGSVPLDLLFQGNQKASILGMVKVLRLPRMLRLMKMFRMFRFKQVLEHHPDISWWLQYSKQANLIRIIQMIVTIGFILHWTACILYLIASTEDWMGIQSCDWGWNKTSHEPVMSACEDSSYSSRYMTAYYSSLLLINGENVNPTTSKELIFATVMLLLGSVLIASIFGNVSISISNFSESSTQSHGKLEQILNIMNHIDLPQPFRKRAVKYYERIWTKYRSLDGELRMFLPELNSSLRAEILVSMRTQIIIEVPLFQKCGPAMIKEMVLKLKDEFHLLGDYIVQTGGIPLGITMVTTGYCEATTSTKLTSPNSVFDEKDEKHYDDVQESNKSPLSLDFTLSRNKSKKVVPLPPDVIATTEKVIKVFSEGDHFGDLALICSCQAIHNIRSATDVEICTLSKADLDEILAQQPDHNKLRNTIKSMVLYEHQDESSSDLALFQPIENDEENEVANIDEIYDQMRRVEELLEEFQAVLNVD